MAQTQTSESYKLPDKMIALIIIPKTKPGMSIGNHARPVRVIPICEKEEGNMPHRFLGVLVTFGCVLEQKRC